MCACCGRGRGHWLECQLHPACSLQDTRAAALQASAWQLQLQQHSLLAGYWINSALTACGRLKKRAECNSSPHVTLHVTAPLVLLHPLAILQHTAQSAEALQFPSLSHCHKSAAPSVQCPGDQAIVAWRKINILTFSSHGSPIYPWLRVNFIQFSGQNWKAAINERDRRR